MKTYKTLSDCENNLQVWDTNYAAQERTITVPISQDGFHVVRCSTMANNVSPFLRAYVVNDKNVSMVVSEGYGKASTYSYICTQPMYLKAGSQLKLQISNCNLLVFRFN